MQWQCGSVTVSVQCTVHSVQSPLLLSDSLSLSDSALTAYMYDALLSVAGRLQLCPRLFALDHLTMR